MPTPLTEDQAGVVVRAVHRLVRAGLLDSEHRTSNILIRLNFPPHDAAHWVLGLDLMLNSWQHHEPVAVREVWEAFHQDPGGTRMAILIGLVSAPGKPPPRHPMRSLGDDS